MDLKIPGLQVFVRQLDNVKARIGAATSAAAAAGKMRAIWARQSTPLSLKMRIYKSGVCSRLTYDSETWRLDSRTRKMLNGANSRLVAVARITNRSPHEEASTKTDTNVRYCKVDPRQEATMG